ncbi:MAG: hypothetical protein V2A73_04040 [Pseudomonadota bacterium]
MTTLSQSNGRRNGIRAASRAGMRVLGAHWRLLLALYLVELFFASLFVLAGALLFGSRFSSHPLFDRAVGGDLAALVTTLRSTPVLVDALVVIALVIALTYFVVSLFLTAGLLGVLVGREFGRSTERFFAFAKLSLLSLVPYTVGVVLLLVGLAVSTDMFVYAVDVTSALRTLANLLLGAVVLFVAGTAVDYARIALTRQEQLGATRALIRSFGMVLSRPLPLLHYALYLLSWGGLTLAYLGITAGHELAGTGGALLLFLLRQILAFSRLAARIAAYGGQLDIAKEVL